MKKLIAILAFAALTLPVALVAQEAGTTTKSETKTKTKTKKSKHKKAKAEKKDETTK